MTITAAILVGVAAIGTGVSVYSQMEAQDAQEKAQKEYQARLRSAMDEAKENELAYTASLEAEEASYDPYDVDDYMASLYEGVLRPMEIEFEENDLQELQDNWNVGASGQGLTSGNAVRAEQEARRGLAVDKARIRAEGRNTAIVQASDDYDRRINNLQLGYGARMNTVNTNMSAAGGIYTAAVDSASAKAAVGSAIGSGITSLATVGLSAYAPKTIGSSKSSILSQLSVADGSQGGRHK